MKGNKLRGFLKLASGVLLAIALIVTCTSQVNANSVPGLTIERAVPLLLPNTPTPITSWGIYLLAGLLVVAVSCYSYRLAIDEETDYRTQNAGTNGHATNYGSTNPTGNHNSPWRHHTSTVPTRCCSHIWQAANAG